MCPSGPSSSVKIGALGSLLLGPPPLVTTRHTYSRASGFSPRIFSVRQGLPS